MDNLARQVFDEQNRLRTNPASFIPYLQEMLSQFKGMVLYKPGEVPLQTHEGPGAVQECINFLRALQPLKALTWDDNMSRAAKDHATDIGPKGISGHTGSDGSSMSARLTRYGDWMGKIGENIDFGGKTGKDVVISLIVDDGVMNRGHRSNILSKDFAKTGVACAAHSQWDACTVLDYASEYTHKGGALSGVLLTGSTPIQQQYSQQPSQQYSQQPLQNTQVQVNYESLGRDVFLEQNKVRQNPKSLIPYLEEHLKYFQGMVLKKPGDIPLRTNEGPGAVQDAINFLRVQQPIHALEWDDNIAKACSDHAHDIGPKSLCSHTGTDGSSMSQRLERYGEWNGKIGENCDFGNTTGRDVVISLIVDDGVSNRGHRSNLFSFDFKKTGISCAQHAEYKVCCVIDYAAQYGQKGVPNVGGGGGGGYSQPSYMQQQPQQQQQSYQPSGTRGLFFVDNDYATGGGVNGFSEKTYKTVSPVDNSTTTTTSKTYSTSDISDPYIQEQLKKFNLDPSVVQRATGQVQNDPEKPPNTIETLTQKNIQIVNGRKTITETKTYKLADGSQRITERTYYE